MGYKGATQIISNLITAVIGLEKNNFISPHKPLTKSLWKGTGQPQVEFNVSKLRPMFVFTIG